MSGATYTLKISPQGQLTLPRDLRERLHVQPGSRVTVTVEESGNLRASNRLPITKRFGTLTGVWTKERQDTAEYTRELRNAMQPKNDQESLNSNRSESARWL
jgi:AbrB family looped-hinge helix DNA binding protein